MGAGFFARHASQYERKALEILNFKMTLNRRKIGPGNGLDKDSYFLQDAVLQAWGVAPDNTGRYSYATGVWSKKGEAVREARCWTGEESREKLTLVVEKLKQVEDMRRKDMDTYQKPAKAAGQDGDSSWWTTRNVTISNLRRCRPRCAKCKDCDAVRKAESHQHQLRLIEETREEMESMLINLESLESSSSSEGSSDGDEPQDESDETDQYEKQRNMIAPIYDDDYAKLAGQCEREALRILGFDIEHEGVLIGVEIGDAGEQHGIDDKGFLWPAILKDWGIEKDTRGNYEYVNGMWGLLGKAAEKAGQLSAKVARKRLPDVIAMLVQVEDYRQEDMDKRNPLGAPTSSCPGLCAQKDECPHGCDAVRIYNNHKFQKKAIEQCRVKMSSLLRNLPQEEEALKAVALEEEALEAEAALKKEQAENMQAEAADASDDGAAELAGVQRQLNAKERRNAKSEEERQQANAAGAMEGVKRAAELEQGSAQRKEGAAQGAQGSGGGGLRERKGPVGGKSLEADSSRATPLLSPLEKRPLSIYFFLFFSLLFLVPLFLFLRREDVVLTPLRDEPVLESEEGPSFLS
ncbi:hypothetical protein T484DRAFT_1982961 [Baffinella frigidus]|nr:hypothetical protein T484DRAFT_1982961 [Cryptophyta sp. CCMP2293]